eukprot:10614757-Heterocapsa_arctica.AAC.1
MPGHPLLWEQCSQRGPEGHDFARERRAVTPEVGRDACAWLAQDVVHTAASLGCPWPPRGWQPR